MVHFGGGFDKKELHGVKKLQKCTTKGDDDRVGIEIDGDLVGHA